MQGYGAQMPGMGSMQPMSQMIPNLQQAPNSMSQFPSQLRQGAQNLYNQYQPQASQFMQDYGPALKDLGLGMMPMMGGAAAGYLGGPSMMPYGMGLGAGLSSYLQGGNSRTPYTNSMQDAFNNYSQPTPDYENIFRLMRNVERGPRRLPPRQFAINNNPSSMFNNNPSSMY